MNPLNDIEIGESLLMSTIKSVATIVVKTEYGVIFYKKYRNIHLN